MSRTHMLAWAAGFFDGEGYVVIQERNSKINGKRYRGYYLRVGLKHVAPNPIYELQKVFGGTVRIERRKFNSDGCKRKDIHVWQVSCNQAKDCLTQLMPYLQNKTNVANLGIEFQKTMQDSKVKISEEMNLYRAMLKNQITKYNSFD